jgi:D-tyrosyl-tRNA(Tyr) deacylase
MKAVIQRVSEAKVVVDGETVSRIGKGILVFLSIERGDTESDMEYTVRKVSQLRIFEDHQKKMNLTVMDAQGEVLVVSQFTLAADCRKGNRPSFDNAESPDKSYTMYREFIAGMIAKHINVATGEFGAFMQVSLVNDGPATFIIDSKK